MKTRISQQIGLPGSRGRNPTEATKRGASRWVGVARLVAASATALSIAVLDTPACAQSMRSVSTNVVVTEVQRTWNRPDTAKHGALYDEFAPHYRAVGKSDRRAQETAAQARK